MKRILISLILVLLVILQAPCGGKAEAEKTQESPAARATEPEPFSIGYPSAPIAIPTIIAMEENRRAVAEAAGGELMLEVFDFTPEGTINAIEKLLAAGCDGVIVTPMADSTLPKITKMCEEAGAYWVISMRGIDDPEVKKIVETSPYFIGYVNESEEESGYRLTRELGELGAKKFAIISTAKGDTTGAARERGMAKAAAEYGMELVAEVRALAQASDAAKAVQSFIAAYPDLDGVILIGTTAPGADIAAAKAIEESGKDIMYATVNNEAGIEEYMDKGIVKVITGPALVLDSAMAAAVLVNKIIGTPLSEGIIHIPITNFVFRQSDDLKKYAKYVEGELPIYTAEEIRADLLKFYNPSLTVDDLIKLVNEFSAEDVYQRHKNLLP